MRAQRVKPGRKAVKQKRSPLEVRFAREIALYAILKPTEEHQFCGDRKWRFDFAFVDLKIAVEIEGGIHNGGAHTRAKGFVEDCEKYNRAALEGWTVLRYAGSMLPGAAREVAEFVASKMRA
ncbi:hypothetical protein UFOVP602_21 [uncultured Caudovirales phage]|uniref:DUF559 domain-containing protein n=1 Tax=uncultured Caudovirales phage TaxID=2100421 RepID=A0A6J5N3Y2_9CAUD|nr:hypothetical protein UFOVP602_21 [uncultured Caudovirales phage]